MDQIPGGGVPHLQRQIIGGGDHSAVMAIPRHHGNLKLSDLVFQWRRVVFPDGKILKNALRLTAGFFNNLICLIFSTLLCKKKKRN